MLEEYNIDELFEVELNYIKEVIDDYETLDSTPVGTWINCN